MSKRLLDQVARHRSEIKYDVLSYGLSELISMHRAEEIQIQPEYQRLFRWDREQQSLFIESLVLEIPIPPLFFYENEHGRWELLDGLQRLSTAIKFVGSASDVPEAFRGPDNNDADWHYDTQNTLADASQLMAGDYLTELAGLSYQRLPPSLQLNLKRSRIQLYVLKRETPSRYKYEVFKRLNTAGAQLADQEIRNCATRLLGDRFPNYLHELAQYPQFASTLDLDMADVRALKADELALRFLAMKNNHQHFRHDVKMLLNSGSSPTFG